MVQTKPCPACLPALACPKIVNLNQYLIYDSRPAAQAGTDLANDREDAFN